MNYDLQTATATVANPAETASPAGTPRVAFLFPGEGSRQVDLARPLYDTEPVFRAAVDACAIFLQPLLKHDLRSTLFPSQAEHDAAERDIHRPLFTQPCVFTIGYAFARFWMFRGVKPALLIGHGIGEYVAAVIAGSFTLENALTLLACRARLMHDLPAGGMLAIHTAADRLTLPDGIDLAAIDSPDRCTVAGTHEAIYAYRKLLEARNTPCYPVRSSHAFHSAAMEPITRIFAGDAAMIPCGSPSIPWISTSTGRYMDGKTLEHPSCWVHQLRQPVDFHGALTTAFADKNLVLLEVGHGHALTDLARCHPDRGTAPVFASHLDENTGLAGVCGTLDKLLNAGVEISPNGIDPERPLPHPPPAIARQQPDARDVRIDFTKIESVLESHPSVSQAIASVRDGQLIGYLRTATTSSSGHSGTAAIDSGAVDATVERIRNYAPRRIFEIGCGSGQLLTRLASSAKCYWASAPSQSAIENLRKILTQPQVKLSHRPTDDFSGQPDGSFDTVIIHSVAQSFPNATYLARVLEGAGRLLAPGGRIFLADMVGNALLPVRHAAALASRVPEGTTVGQLRESIAIRVSRETALAVDPAWFDHLIVRITDLGPVEILLRRGTDANGDCSHRYDVILHKQPHLRLHPLPPATPWGNLNLEQLEAILHRQPQDLHLTGIPDARLAADIAFHRALAAARPNSPLPPVPHRPANTASVEDLFQLAAQAGFTAHVRWQGDGTSGLLEAAFLHDSPAAIPAWPRAAAPLPPASLVNKPYLPHSAGHALAPDLSDHLASRLPSHLIPSVFVVVKDFPLTPAGLVDRDALPPPDATDRPASRTLVPAANAAESRLLEIWKQVLGRNDIGTTDDIFDLGADSILVFQIATRASRHGLAVTPAQILRLRTVSAVVAALSEPAR